MSTSVFGRAAEPIVIDVWSDVVCPFCYLGHAVLEESVAQFPYGVEIRYHSFQLNPGMKVGQSIRADDYLAAQVHLPKEQIEASHAHLTERGARSGLDYRF